ncbi:MAG: hypothetical protein ACFFG0_20605 [Candidatus Thorarchaeota archaeon]
MRSAKYFALIVAILGALTVLLSLFLPVLLGWYRIVIHDISGPDGYYLNGFGIIHTSDPWGLPIPPGIELLVFSGPIGGMLVLVGAVACVGGTFREKKNIAIIGGVLMVLGPFLIVLDMIIG